MPSFDKALKRVIFRQKEDVATFVGLPHFTSGFWSKSCWEASYWVVTVMSGTIFRKQFKVKLILVAESSISTGNSERCRLYFHQRSIGSTLKLLVPGWRLYTLDSTSFCTPIPFEEKPKDSWKRDETKPTWKCSRLKETQLSQWTSISVEKTASWLIAGHLLSEMEVNYRLGCPPAQDASHHDHDSYISRSGDPYLSRNKPENFSLASTGRVGPTQTRSPT